MAFPYNSKTMGIEWEKETKKRLRGLPKGDPHIPFLRHVLAENEEHERALKAASRDALKGMGQLDPKAEVITRSKVTGDLVSERILGGLEDSTLLADVFPQSDDTSVFNSDSVKYDPRWGQLWSELRPDQKVQTATSFNHLMAYVFSYEPSSRTPATLRELITSRTLGDLRALDEQALSLIRGFGPGNTAFVHAAAKRREPQAPRA
jgi:hypothetical protein